MILIGLTALAVAGKDCVANYLVREHGFEKIVFSDMLEEKCKQMGLELNKNNLSLAGDELRKEHGNGAVGILTREKITPGQDTVLSGVRSPEEIDIMKEKYPQFVLVEVWAPPELRFKWLQGSRRDSTLKELKERDERDIKNKGMDKVFERADFRLLNNSSKKELFKNVDKLVEKLHERT